MKIFLVILFVLLGMAGLFMSACGGFFSLAVLLSGDNAFSILAISLPFLAAGVGCLWGAIAGIRRLKRKATAEPAPPAH